MVISQGDAGDGMYIVMEGTVKVVQKDDDGINHVIAESLSAGTYFGEMALINDAPRMATVKANTDLILMKLDSETFFSILGPIHVRRYI